MHTEVGTRAFQAPEMFEKDARTGKPNYRSSVDIFAMGLVFLAMLQTTGGEDLVQQSEFPFWKIISRILYQSLLLNILTTRNQFCYKFLYFSCKLGIHTRYAFMLALQWRIKTGRQVRTPPLLCPNYFIFTQFSAKICKIIG